MWTQVHVVLRFASHSAGLQHVWACWAFGELLCGSVRFSIWGLLALRAYLGRSLCPTCAVCAVRYHKEACLLPWLKGVLCIGLYSCRAGAWRALGPSSPERNCPPPPYQPRSLPDHDTCPVCRLKVFEGEEEAPPSAARSTGSFAPSTSASAGASVPSMFPFHDLMGRGAGGFPFQTHPSTEYSDEDSDDDGTGEFGFGSSRLGHDDHDQGGAGFDEAELEAALAASLADSAPSSSFRGSGSGGGSGSGSGSGGRGSSRSGVTGATPDRLSRLASDATMLGACPCVPCCCCCCCCCCCSWLWQSRFSISVPRIRSFLQLGHFLLVAVADEILEDTMSSPTTQSDLRASFLRGNPLAPEPAGEDAFIVKVKLPSGSSFVRRYGFPRRCCATSQILPPPSSRSACVTSQACVAVT